MTTASPSAEPYVRRLELRGGNAAFWDARDKEILVEGPRGTGKTRTILELIDALCRTFPGLAVLILRKWRVRLAETCLKTFEEQVKRPDVQFFGGNEHEAAGYRYGNGSRISLGGMDDPDKLKSGEFDLVYWNECTEGTEDEWMSLLATLRHTGPDGKDIIANRRLIGDCNPTNSGNWANQRCERGQMRRIKTTIRDNPLYANEDGTFTPEGERYVTDTLSGLRGIKREQWVDGKWTGIEDACYPMFDRSIHIRPLEPGLAFKATIIWIDYGSQHICSVGALSIDQFNRRWVRECWGQPDDDRGKTLNLVIAQFKERYKTRRGRGDPNQKVLNDSHGFNTAKGGNGGATGAPRLARIDKVEPLFWTYEGGRVPTFKEEKALMVPRGPFDEPDSPGILLVEGMRGIDALADQIEGYHFIFTESQKGKSKDVFRENDDHIAGVEYANEEWEENQATVQEVPSAIRLQGSRPTGMGLTRARV